MQYRTDIAGLRAVAVLPILLFHAGVSALPGGFVGVDIFFVISGFLITSIIISELKHNRFSMIEFYRRRVARIIPALALVLLATLGAGVVFMLPSELRELGSSAAAASLFVSNFYFFLTADYFAVAAESKPLLHTWSLAVEEQFYIFYPVLLLILWRWRPGSIRSAVIAVCAISFTIALAFTWLQPEAAVNLISAPSIQRILTRLFQPDAAFYLIFSRAWELGLGALVALGAFPQVRSALVRQVLAISGMALIVGAIVLIRPTVMFPAPLALIPCLGAAMLIAYGQGALTDRLLSCSPMRWIGDLSYSLYLWHWPVITFYRLQTGILLSPIETVGLVAVSFLLAYLSYRWVETPCMKSLRARAAAGRVALGGFFVLLVTAGLSLSVQWTERWKTYPPEVLRLASYADYHDTPDYAYQFRQGVCFMGSADPQSFNADCLRLSDTQQNLVVLGDSYAAQYWRAIAERFPDRNVIQATASGCRPLVNTVGARRCTELMRHVFTNITRRGQVDTVVLIGRWNESEVEDLAATVRSLRQEGLNVVVIGPAVEYDGDFPQIMARAALSEDMRLVEQRRLWDRQALDERMAPIMSSAGATYVSVYKIECPDGVCMRLDRHGAPLHFDYGHVTLDASRELVAGMPIP